MLLIHVKGSVQVGCTVPSLKDGDQSSVFMRVGMVYVHELNIEREASMAFISSKLDPQLIIWYGSIMPYKTTVSTILLVSV